MISEKYKTRTEDAEWGIVTVKAIHRKIKLHELVYSNDSVAYQQAEIIDIPQVRKINKHIKNRVKKSINTFFKYNSLFKMYIQDKEDLCKLLEYPVQQKFLGIKEPFWECYFNIKFGDLEKNIFSSVRAEYIGHSDADFAYTNDGLFLRISWENPAEYTYNHINVWDRKSPLTMIKPGSISEYCVYWKGLKK